MFEPSLPSNHTLRRAIVAENADIRGGSVVGEETGNIAVVGYNVELPAGVKVLARSPEKHRPRGFYCAIGNCASCQMIVDGEPNVRTCITLLREGMRVETQEGKGRIR